MRVSLELMGFVISLWLLPLIDITIVDEIVLMGGSAKDEGFVLTDYLPVVSVQKVRLMEDDKVIFYCEYVYFFNRISN